MNESAYLTFDIGTTALKTALVADDGSMLSVHTHEYSFDAPKPDWAEQDAQTYWQAAVAGARSVISRSGIDPTRVAAIGFSSQGQTFVPVDEAGEPLHKVIVWVDKRSMDIAREWESEWLSQDEYKSISGYAWVPGELTVFKIAWLLRNVPDIRRAWKFLCIPDYLIFRLTGAAATDRITAAMTGMFDLRTGKWDPKLLAAAGVNEEQLPLVMEPGCVAGSLLPNIADELGLRSGIPVCVGANDQIAGALGAGNVRPGIVSETTGTSLAAVVTMQELLTDSRMCVGRHAAEGAFYAMQFANTSAIILKWFRDICSCGESYEEFTEDVGNIAPGSDGLIVLPHFSGSSSNLDARGALMGLTLGHTRAHIARAIMESCCFVLRECLAAIQENGPKIVRVRSLGGAARSDAWLQMKADILGIEVERPACTDAASIGAAMMAAAGTGQFGSIVEASEKWYHPSAVFQPNPTTHERYNEIYKRYLELSDLVYGSST